MRIALLSDIHSNLVALDAVLAATGPVDAHWILGDVVGYGPDPDGVVARLIEIGAVGVRDNHDAAAVGGAEIEGFNPDARQAMEWTRTAISAATRHWLDALPERWSAEGCELVTSFDGGLMTCTGSPSRRKLPPSSAATLAIMSAL